MARRFLLHIVEILHPADKGVWIYHRGVMVDHGGVWDGQLIMTPGQHFAELVRSPPPGGDGIGGMFLKCMSGHLIDIWCGSSMGTIKLRSE